MIPLIFLVVAFALFLVAAVMYEVPRDKLIPAGLAVTVIAAIIHLWP